MAIDFLDRCNTLEECYEFMLAYAGRGVPSDKGNGGESEIRNYLRRAAVALDGLANSCSLAMKQSSVSDPPAQKFISVIERDSHASLAAIELVLAQPGISSQLVDNLNASIHLRAMLTDLFLVGEILRGRNRTNVSS